MNTVIITTITDEFEANNNVDMVFSNETIDAPPPLNLESYPEDNTLILTWGSPQLTGNYELQFYEIFKKTNPESMFESIATGITELTWTDQIVEPGLIYYYAVSAVYSDGSVSENSNTIIGQIYNVNTNSVGFHTAVTNVGTLGDPNSPSTGRPSFEYPPFSGNNYLYDGGFWLGSLVSGEPAVTTYFYSPDHEWLPCPDGGWGRPEKEFFILNEDNPIIETCFDDLDANDDSEHQPLGVRVITNYELVPPILDEESGVFNTASWGKISYSIINLGLNGDLSQLYAGLWLDFDVSSWDMTSPHIDDLVDYDENLKLSYMYDGDYADSDENDSGEFGLSDSYVGIALLNSPSNIVASHTWWNWEDDPGTDLERWQFMTASHPNMEGYQYYPNPLEMGYPVFDYRILQTTGPFDLAGNDTLKIEYLMLFGNDEETIRQNVLTAREYFGYNNYLAGDVNFDGDVDILDIVAIVSFIMGYETPTEQQMNPADFNSDGTVDILDIVAIVTLILDVDQTLERSITEANLIKSIDNFSIQSDGNIAGFELNISGDCEINKDSIPPGWTLYQNNNKVILFNLEGYSLSDEHLFSFTGNMRIESAHVVDWLGNGIYITEIEVPNSFRLNPVYPNPFNPVTTIDYALPNDTDVKIFVYNLLGRQVVQLVDQFQHAGYYSIKWDAGNIASGTYFIKMDAGNYVKTQKAIILK
jgi:hypothetical protein